MSYRTLSLGALGALTLSLLAASSVRGDAVRFQVAEGTSLSRSLQMTLTLNMDGGTISMMGEEQELPPEDEPLEIDAAIDVVDEFTKMDGGVIGALARTYETLAIEAEGDDGGVSDMDLEGKTVHFVRDEDGGYTKSLGDDHEADDALAGLDVDMDFTALLPEGEVEAGATWSVSSGKLRSIFLPGGLPYSEDGETIESVIGTVALPMLSEGCEEFSVSCTYVGTREEDDVLLGEITFEFEGTTGGDAAELIAAISEMEGEADGMPEDMNAEADIDFTGSGTLVWNLKGGHAESFEMIVEPEVAMVMDMSQDMGDQTLEIEFSIDFSGELTWNMKVE